MRINHNIASLNTYRQLSANNALGGKSLEKLSSGLRINRAGDDAAGLAISEKMRGQIRGLDQATRNAQDGISLIQTAEGALNETHSILQRMRELAVQAASDTNTAQDRTNLQDEMDQLTKEIDRIADTTEFNTKKLLDGSMGSAVSAATANVSGNSSLNATLATTTSLMALTDSAGNSLGIEDGDTITLSYIKNGTLVTADISVTTSSTVAALEGADSTTTVASNVLTFTADVAGYAGAVYGITMTVKDSEGNVKTAATNALSAFEETRAAKDVRLDGSATLQIGANNGQNMSLDVENMTSEALGVSNLQIGTRAQADVAIKVIDTATQKVSAERSKLGAIQNRLEHTINNLGTSSENLTAAESRVRDVDMAKEMMEFTKMSILSQAATAMLAQANQQPQSVLQLLGA